MAARDDAGGLDSTLIPDVCGGPRYGQRIKNVCVRACVYMDASVGIVSSLQNAL